MPSRRVDCEVINSTAEHFASLNIPVVDLPQLSHMVGEDVCHRPGGERALQAAVEAGALGATVSGSGSTVIAFATDHEEDIYHQECGVSA